MAARRKRSGVSGRHGSPRQYEVAVAAIVTTAATALVTADRWISRTSGLRSTPGGRRRRGAPHSAAVHTSAPIHRHVKRTFVASLLVVGERRAKANLIGFALALAPWAVIGIYSAMSGPALAPNAALTASSTAPPVPSLDETIEIVPLDSPPPTASTQTQVAPVGLMTLHSEQQLVAVANRSVATTGLPIVPTVAVPLGATSIPRIPLIAYVYAAQRQQKLSSYCNLNWSTLAAIGYIESDHAKRGGSASPSWNGISNPHILGPELDGTDGYARISDSDHGALDGDATYDRAVGPMQFLPATWQEYAVSANPGRLPDPENIFDATEAAARYLCADGLDLRVPANLVAAIYGYNHSLTYVDNVVTVAGSYAGANPAEIAAALAAAQVLFAPAGPQPVSAAESAVGIAPTPIGSAVPTPSGSPTSAPVYWPVAPDPIGTAEPTTSPSGPASPTATDSAAPESPSASPSASLTPAPTSDPSSSPAPTPTASLTPTPTLTTAPSALPNSPPPTSSAASSDLPSGSPPVVASPEISASVTPDPVTTSANS